MLSLVGQNESLGSKLPCRGRPGWLSIEANFVTDFRNTGEKTFVYTLHQVLPAKAQQSSESWKFVSARSAGPGYLLGIWGINLGDTKDGCGTR